MPDPIPSAPLLRPATPADVSTLFHLIQALAEYEKLSHAVVGSATALDRHLFGSPRYVEALLAEQDGQPVGFALFFQSYSAPLAQLGLYLEDLFVLPEHRGSGVGKALLSGLAQTVLERQWGWLGWSVLDWNTPAIGFYERMGATLLTELRVCRAAGAELRRLSTAATDYVRAAVPADIPALLALVQASATLQHRLSDFANQEDRLAEHLFGDRPAAEAVVSVQAGQISGFALFVPNYSTFLTKPGLYIEDLFVLPEQQGQLAALLAAVAQRAADRDFGRVEWLVPTWNAAAIAAYERLGAQVLPDWRICRVQGEALSHLAQQGAIAAIKN